MYFKSEFPPELGIVVLCPSQLVQMAVQQYLSEKLVLEAQLMNVSQDGENPLISNNNEGGTQLDVSDGVDSSESVDGVLSVNSGDNGEENPATEDGNEIPVTSSVVEGEEEGEQEGVGSKEGPAGTAEQATSEDLPPYFSEVHVTSLCMWSDFHHAHHQLSAVGALGCQAYLSLCRGDQVQDHITVAIIVEKLRYRVAQLSLKSATLSVDFSSVMAHLRSLPSDSSWILDSFPTTLEQARVSLHHHMHVYPSMLSVCLSVHVSAPERQSDWRVYC